MKITRNSDKTTPGSPEEFTGNAYFDTVAKPEGLYRINATNVRFTPGSRTAWHTHPNGQTIYITEGIARVGRRGEVDQVKPGDRVFFEPGEDHWHGATPDRFMSHLSLVQADENGKSIEWKEHVTDEEYHSYRESDSEA